MLVLFGDSFVSEWDSSDHPSWFDLLAKELNTTYKTYGTRGSSFEYSTLMFYQYLMNDYDSEDVIVFVLTSPNRSPVVTDEFDPSWAAQAYGKVFYKEQNSRDKKIIDGLSDSSEHYNRYRTYYKDWFMLQSNDLILAQRYVLLTALHSLSNKTVSLSGWDTELPISNKFNNHLSASLWQAAENQITDGHFVDLLSKHGRDFRQNHFHEENHIILKNGVYSCLTDGDTTLTVDSFAKNLYSIK